MENELVMAEFGKLCGSKDTFFMLRSEAKKLEAAIKDREDYHLDIWEQKDNTYSAEHVLEYFIDKR